MIDSFPVGNSDQIVSSLTATNDYSKVAIGLRSGIIKIIDTKSREQIEVLNAHDAAVSTLRFNQDNTLLASGSYDRTARIWKLNSQGTPPIEIESDQWISAVAFNNESLIVGNYDGAIKEYFLDNSALASDLCRASLQKLSKADWELHVATDIPYEEPCANE